MQPLEFIRKRGREIEEVMEGLAGLRIAVFREFPYLYEGSTEYETEYLQPYVRSERSLLFAVYAQNRMVGATTCLPLADETENVRQAFERAGWDVNTLFYFGESVLLPQYRGIGLGHRFFEEREQHARSFGRYRKACFLSVERELNHPNKPINYRSNEAFWQKRGWQKIEGIRAKMEWPDVGEQESSAKSLVGWMIDL